MRTNTTHFIGSLQTSGLERLAGLIDHFVVAVPLALFLRCIFAGRSRWLFVLDGGLHVSSAQSGLWGQTAMLRAVTEGICSFDTKID